MNQIMLLAAENTLAALCLALLIYGLTRFWRNPPLEHLAWLLVLVKLLAPPLVAIDRPAPPPPVAEAALAEEPQGAEGLQLADETQLDADEPAATTDAIASSAQMAPAGLAAIEDGPGPDVSLESVWARLGPVLFGLWLAGAALWVLVTALRTAGFGRMLGETLPAPERVQRLTAEIAAKLELRSVPAVRYVDSVAVPLVWWAGRRPTIALPIGLVAQWDDEQLALVLAHELAHLRRRDHWVRAVELVVSCLYWWNPLVWPIRRQLHRAEDVCCDAWVRWAFPDCPARYAELMLRVAESLGPAQGRARLLPASQFLRSHSLKGRIEMILENRFAPGVSKKSVLAVALLAIIVLPSAVPSARAKEEDSPAASDAAPAPAAAAPAPTPAPTPAPAPAPGLEASALAKRFKYRIPLELGRTQVREGGKIEIQEVWGTRPKIEIGGQYLVRGKYVLPEGRRGKLYFYLTSKGPSGPTNTLDLQSTELDDQKGFFTLVHGMSEPGYFHLILTDAKSYSDWFANVYFGSGDNVYREPSKETQVGVRGDGAEFPHIVRFKPEETGFLNGDRIAISEVRGTSDRFAPGNTYQIKGTYTLASRDKATLAADVVAAEQRRRGPPWPTVEAIQVERGDGTFTLRLAMTDPGRPRLVFSPISGTEKNFGSVYLDTVEGGDRASTDQAATEPAAIDPASATQSVKFELGTVQFSEGDSITITEVRGTSDTFSLGNTYRVKGTYKLASREKAVLAAFVTGTDGGGRNVKTLSAQRLPVERGEATFELVLPMTYRGQPHVSFYPGGDGGSSFGGIYFGTGKSVKK